MKLLFVGELVKNGVKEYKHHWKSSLGANLLGNIKIIFLIGLFIILAIKYPEFFMVVVANAKTFLFNNLHVLQVRVFWISWSQLENRNQFC